MPVNSKIPNGNQNRFMVRQSKLGRTLEQNGFAGLALNPGPSLTYLTGLHFHLSERPVVGFFTPGNPPIIILPELESGKLSGLDFPITGFSYGEDPSLWPAAFAKGINEAGLDRQTIGIETLQMRVLELNLLQQAKSTLKFQPADECIAELRQIKDQDEANAMRKAVSIAQTALKHVLQSFHLGMTERDFSAELTLQLLRNGSDSELPFPPIVSAGPNSANPHAVPTNRPIQTGDLLVVDWGATYMGYISDLTRTFKIGSVTSEFEKIGDIVLRANTAGREACRPGCTADSIDKTARSVIENEGYGQYFIHRTGHGIGIEAHENPYIRSENLLKLLPGMCFTIEPGIYLPGRGGVRVEDNVMITENKVECFSDIERALQTLPMD